MEKNEEAVRRGIKILDLRKSKGISRRGLARIINISDTALANIERGNTTTMTVELGKKICDALHISFNELFEIDFPEASNDKNQVLEIEQLKKRISELEEQLDDKRRIIKFLSDNDFTLDIAAKIYHLENPRGSIEYDFSDPDSLIKQLDEMPYNPGDKQSQIQYIEQWFKLLQKNKKE